MGGGQGNWYRDQYMTMCRADAASPQDLTVDTGFISIMKDISDTTETAVKSSLSCTPTTQICSGISDLYKMQADVGADKLQSIEYPNVLFNLYPYRYSALSTNFTSIPELTLRQTTFKYFLKDLDSLITIWEDEGVEVDNTVYIMIDRENKGGKINIWNSIFDYSRFCKGLVAYNYWHYKYSSAEWKYYSEATTQKADEIDLNYGISIKNSEFNRLNILNERSYAKTLTKSGSLDVIHPTIVTTFSNVDFQLYKFLHKGIVLNLQAFPGSIYISDSTFLYLYIYIYISIERIRI